MSIVAQFKGVVILVRPLVAKAQHSAHGVGQSVHGRRLVVVVRIHIEFVVDDQLPVLVHLIHVQWEGVGEDDPGDHFIARWGGVTPLVTIVIVHIGGEQAGQSNGGVQQNIAVNMLNMVELRYQWVQGIVVNIGFLQEQGQAKKSNQQTTRISEELTLKNTATTMKESG